MDPGFLLFPGLAAALLVAAAMVACFAECRRLTRVVLAAEAQRDSVLADERGAVRALRLAAIELRGPATTLLGHADRLRADAGPGLHGDRQNVAADGAAIGATIGAIAHQMLDLADDMQHHALADAASRVLHERPTRLAVALKDAITVVQSGLEPSRRQWLLPPDIDAIELLVDRRALGQILARVLGNAARFSRLDDWIDISFEFDGDHFVLLVADEGIGLFAGGHAGAPGPADSRGLGLGLALARVLMEAHDGALRVEAVPSVGTRVRLHFPMTRLLRMAQGAAAAPSVGLPAGVPFAGVPFVGVPFAGAPVGSPICVPSAAPVVEPIGERLGKRMAEPMTMPVSLPTGGRAAEVPVGV